MTSTTQSEDSTPQRVFHKRPRAGNLYVVGGLFERAGASLRRAPYVWLIATILLTFVTNDGLLRIAENNRHPSTPIAIIAAFAIAYATVLAVIFPRVGLRKPSPTLTENRLAVLRWIFALTPYLLGYCAVAIGSQQWPYGLGLVTSLTLLVLAARRIRHAKHEA